MVISDRDTDISTYNMLSMVYDEIVKTKRTLRVLANLLGICSLSG